jgi:hypothetical protein
MNVIDNTADGREKQRESLYNELASACLKDRDKGEQLLEKRLRDTESVTEFKKRTEPAFKENERTFNDLIEQRKIAHRKVYGGWTPPPKKILA